MCDAGVFPNLAAAVKLFETMIDAGHRYRTIEAALGTSGVCLVLGNDLLETK